MQVHNNFCAAQVTLQILHMGGAASLDAAADFIFIFFLRKIIEPLKIVLVLLSASVERFFVSRMRDFLNHIFGIFVKSYMSQ